MGLERGGLDYLRLRNFQTSGTLTCSNMGETCAPFTGLAMFVVDYLISNVAVHFLSVVNVNI